MKKIEKVFKMKTNYTIAGIYEMVDSINTFILAERRFTKKVNPELPGISLSKTHKIEYDDLTFSQVSCHRVQKMLTPEHKV